MYKYLRFSASYVLIAITAAGFVLGGHWMWLGIAVAIVGWVGGDLISGDDLTEPEYHHPAINDIMLHLVLPVLALGLFVYIWAVSEVDLLGFGSLVHSITGYDALAARETNTLLDYYGASLGIGLNLAMQGVIVGHELIGRTWDPKAMFTGRWLFGLSCGMNFVTEHVYGHHHTIATPEDPSTGIRGENFYVFTTLRTWQQWVHGWGVEKSRLEKMGKSVFNWRNHLLRANLRSIFMLTLVYLAGGLFAIGWYLLACVWSKLTLETFNYMAHYGLVREPGKPVRPAHSWNSNSRISAIALFNLPRHSHHHADGTVPYQELRAYPNMPTTPTSYLGTSLCCYIPALWNKLMIPKLLDWDENHATPAEQAIAARQNAASGLAELEESAKRYFSEHPEGAQAAE
jgi:alkane 1-monooxygenase